MIKIRTLKFILIIAVLLITATSYGAWKVIRDIKEIELPAKTKSEVTELSENEPQTKKWKILSLYSILLIGRSTAMRSTGMK